MDDQHEDFDEQEVRDLLAALGRTITPDARSDVDPDAGTDAEAPAPEPIPADVARRLDDLLSELVTERSRGTTAPVVPLRRRSGWLAAAGIAAAVVLATVLLPAVLDPDPTPAPTADNGSATEESASERKASEETASEERPADDVGSEGAGAAAVVGDVELSGPLVDDGTAAYPEEQAAQDAAPRRGAPHLQSDLQPHLGRETLARDVVDLLAALPTQLPASTRNCTWDGAGDAYDVTLDGRRGLAVVTGDPGTERVVRLLACTAVDEPVEVATATVPPH